MEKIHIRNLFRIWVPLNRNLGSALPNFLDHRFSFNIKLVCTDKYGNIKHEPTDCFTWAKRNPVIFQKADANNVDGTFFRLKINQGIFDLRKTKDRLFLLIVDFVENGLATKTGTSQIWELFPKKRQREREEVEVVAPIYWLGEDGYVIDTPQHHSAESSSVISPTDNFSHRLTAEVGSNSIEYHEVQGHDTYVLQRDEVSTSLNEAIFGDEMIGVESPNQFSTAVHEGVEYDTSETNNYMVLYNGNAEVVGNFRALNFYKASDVNIKEDVHLLEQGILHVDYESLIPYLSESIKQNYSDIQSVTSDVERMQQVIDHLYEQFTTGTKKKSHQGDQSTAIGQTTKRRKMIGWILGSLAMSILIASVVIGVVFFTSKSPLQKTSTVPLTSLTPTLRPAMKPLLPANYERNLLLEMYDAMWTNTMTNPPWNLSAPHCSCRGINCDETTGRVVSIYLRAFSLDIMGRFSTDATIPASIGNFTELVSLDLMENNLTSTIPATLMDLKNLVYLKLSMNNLVGTLPDFNRLEKLKELDLSKNSLSMNDKYLAMLMQHHSIHNINLENIPIHATLPSIISSSLLDVNLKNCSLSGTIPKSWEDSNIEHLRLSYNNLTGSIPCFGSAVINLIASHNDFDGEFCGRNFANLVQLTITDTNLTGEFDLPDMDLSRFYFLDVQRNQFTSFMRSAMNVSVGPDYCNAADNPLQCPMPPWAQLHCKATCN